uniref:Nucleoporin_C domain-containing protein n=1 Tax=Mesocestoides corti TaxID=53468 RepID=A0A5K3EM07_MESCO
MDSSFTAIRGGPFTYWSHPKALLVIQNLVPTLPTFLTETLLSSDGSADIKLFAHDWIGVVTDGRLFLWPYSHSRDSKIAPSSSCRQFVLPSGGKSMSAVVAVSFEGERPNLCAVVVGDVLRLWSRGVCGTVSRSQVVHDFTDTKLCAFKTDESCIALDQGPCPGTFLLATNHGRIFGIDATTPQDRVSAFLLADGFSTEATGSSFLNSSVTSVEDKDRSLLSGLSRRVSSIWSYATSRVPAITRSNNEAFSAGKVVRFLVDGTNAKTGKCRACLLTRGRLVVWQIDAEFECTLMLTTELNNDQYGEAIDMALTPLLSLWILCKSPGDSSAEEPLSLFSVDINQELSDATPSAPVPVAIEHDSLNVELIAPLTGVRTYPCSLLAVFSRESRVIFIIEALTGRCVCQVEFEQTSPLIGVTSAPEGSNALFAFVTRQRGIYSLGGEDPCLANLNCRQLIDRLSRQSSKHLTSDQIDEVLSRTAALLWMGYEQESNDLIRRFFGGSSSAHRGLGGAISTAFLRLVRRILDSRPASSSDARSHATATAATLEFDFARSTEGSRFLAKQQAMQSLCHRLWHSVVATFGDAGENLSTNAIASELFSITNEHGHVASPGVHHLLNAFLIGAELCECANVLYAKSVRNRQYSFLRPIFKAVLQESELSSVNVSLNLLKLEEIFFQTVSLIPKFISKLAEQLVNRIKECLTDDTESTEFVTLAAQLITASLSEALTYRQKLLPALSSVIADESSPGSATDLFCWITGCDGVRDELLSVFNALADVVAESNEAGRSQADGLSLKQECACQAVELATIILQAGDQRIKWAPDSTSTSAWFSNIRSELISAVAWRLMRPEAALDLAIRFVDKELIVTICNHLDKLAGNTTDDLLSRRNLGHAHLINALLRLPQELQLADYALQWHYSQGDKARVQSLLVALQDKKEQQKRHMSSPQSLFTSTKRPRHALSTHSPTTYEADTSVSRFLQRREARDFAWLHQLRNGEFDKAGAGLFTAGTSECGALGRRKTLLSLSKLAFIAAGHRELCEDLPTDKAIPRNFVLTDKHLEVICLQEDLVKTKSLHTIESMGDAVTSAAAASEPMTASGLARLYVSESVLRLFSSKQERMTAFTSALRLAQLAVDVDESADAETEELLQHIWMEALNVESWKEPDKEADCHGMCAESFFHSLLEHCLLTGQVLETVFPPIEEFLSRVGEEHGQWLRLLIQYCYDETLQRFQQKEPVTIEA